MSTFVSGPDLDFGVDVAFDMTYQPDQAVRIRLAEGDVYMTVDQAQTLVAAIQWAIGQAENR